MEEPRFLAKIGLSLGSFSDSLKEVFYILMLSTERSQKKIMEIKKGDRCYSVWWRDSFLAWTLKQLGL